MKDLDLTRAVRLLKVHPGTAVIQSFHQFIADHTVWHEVVQDLYHNHGIVRGVTLRKIRTQTELDEFTTSAMLLWFGTVCLAESTGTEHPRVRSGRIASVFEQEKHKSSEKWLEAERKILELTGKPTLREATQVLLQEHGNLNRVVKFLQSQSVGWGSSFLRRQLTEALRGDAAPIEPKRQVRGATPKWPNAERKILVLAGASNFVEACIALKDRYGSSGRVVAFLLDAKVGVSASLLWKKISEALRTTDLGTAVRSVAGNAVVAAMKGPTVVTGSTVRRPLISHLAMKLGAIASHFGRGEAPETILSRLLQERKGQENFQALVGPVLSAAGLGNLTAQEYLQLVAAPSLLSLTEPPENARPTRKNIPVSKDGGRLNWKQKIAAIAEQNGVDPSNEEEIRGMVARLLASAGRDRTRFVDSLNAVARDAGIQQLMGMEEDAVIAFAQGS